MEWWKNGKPQRFLNWRWSSYRGTPFEKYKYNTHEGLFKTPALSNFINFFQRFTLVSPASRFTNVLFANLWSRFAYVLGQFPNSAFAWSVAERTRYIHAYRTLLYHAWENGAYTCAALVSLLSGTTEDVSETTRRRNDRSPFQQFDLGEPFLAQDFQSLQYGDFLELHIKKLSVFVPKIYFLRIAIIIRVKNTKTKGSLFSRFIAKRNQGDNFGFKWSFCMKGPGWHSRRASF